MRLRPVDAIFVEPKSKFIVIYQNGKLWQLTRMKIDKASWLRKKPYKGDYNILYLRPEQVCDDEYMSQLLETEKFPENITRISLAKFLNWWQANGYQFLKDKEEQGVKAQLDTTTSVSAQNEKASTVNQIDKAQPTPQPVQENTPQTSNEQTNNESSQKITQKMTMQEKIRQEQQTQSHQAQATQAVSANNQQRIAPAQQTQETRASSTNKAPINNQVANATPENQATNANDINANNTIDNMLNDWESW